MLVRDADFQGAKLLCKGNLREQPWNMSKNWRSAKFDNATTSFLTDQYGGGPYGHRILMIMWEFPHHVTGGGWTAAFHLLRKLLQQGRAVTVLVPWKRVDIDFSVFGHDLEVICAGMEFPAPEATPRTQAIVARTAITAAIKMGATSLKWSRNLRTPSSPWRPTRSSTAT